jgi:hypothetical protein
VLLEEENEEQKKLTVQSPWLMDIQEEKELNTIGSAVPNVFMIKKKGSSSIRRSDRYRILLGGENEEETGCSSHVIQKRRLK